MFRPFLGLLALCLMVGCEKGNSDSTEEVFHSSFVPLPYKKVYGKGEASIDIQAIPGRTDAVQVKARVWRNAGDPIMEWTQEGCSVKQIPTSDESGIYDFSILEMRSSDNAVSEVRLSIVKRYKSGPR
jgi:hypothetical protein